MSALYICPICQHQLFLKDHSYTCLQKHSFDLAKEGYVNLLPVQFKHSKNPGDNKAMVNARRLFLEQGYYQPLIDKLVNIYNTELINDDGNFLDAGCGEGYYAHQFKNNKNQVYGVDVAKEAIKKAAKKYKHCHFSVGSVAQLPFESNSFNCIISVYAPIIEKEFTRLLAVNGFLITVTPATKHLHELKSLIYKEVKEHNIEKEVIKNLTLIKQEQVSYSMTLNTGADALNLLSMTPFAFKASEQVKARLSITNNFICQADFLIKVYKKEEKSS